VQHLLEPLPHLHQNFVAGSVAMTIVDYLEWSRSTSKNTRSTSTGIGLDG
jgi:hypothetical protein